MSSVQINVFGALSAQKRMEVLALPPRKRRQLLGGIGREIKRQSIRNLRAGRDVDGKPWEARKRGNDRRLLRRLNRQVSANILTNDYVDVGFKGGVAFQQHEGATKTMTSAEMHKEQMRSKKRQEKQESLATSKQAKSLRSAGYKIRVKGTKKWRRPSLKWIKENLKQKQAGLILRRLRDETPKQSWLTKVPGRSFLGATQADVNRFVEKIYDNTIHSRV